MSSSNTNTLAVTIPVTANTSAFNQQVQQAVSNANAQKAVVSVVPGVSTSQGQQSGYSGAAGVAHGAAQVTPASSTPGRGAPHMPTVQHPNVGGAYQGGGAINPPAPPNSGRPPVSNPMSNPNYYNARFSTNGNMGVRSRLSGDHIMALEAGYAASRIGGEYVQLQANQARNGGNDVTGQAQLIASGISAGIGLAAGIGTRNPGIGLAAASISGAILTPVANYLSAGADNKQNAANSIGPFMGSYSGMPNGYLNNRLFPHITPAGGFSSGSLERITDIANSRNPGYDGERRGTIKDTAAAYGAIASGLFQGGFDPLSKSGQTYDRYVTDPLAATRERHSVSVIDPANTSSMSNIDAMRRIAIDAIANSKRRIVPGGEETLAETYTRRIATLFGAKEAPAMSKRMATLFGGLPDTGTNQADLLMHYGAEDLTTYNRIQNEKGETAVDPMTLSRASAGIRTGERYAKRAASLARGSGAAMEKAITHEMAYVADLPGGRDSDLYQSMGAQQRQARLQKYNQQDTTTYALPFAGMDAAERIHEYMPYQPGYSFGMAYQRLGLRSKYITELSGRYDKEKGRVSENEQLAMYQQLQEQKVAQARDIGTLSVGGEDRAFLMASGKPSSASRLDSMQMAATALYRVGSPNRRYGAINAAQATFQRNFVSSYDSPGFDADRVTAPQSRSSNMDNTAVLSYLARIANALESVGGSLPGRGIRSGELRSSINSALGLSDVLGLPPEGVN